MRPRRHLGGGVAWAVQAELGRGARLEDTFGSREHLGDIYSPEMDEITGRWWGGTWKERGLGQSLRTPLWPTPAPLYLYPPVFGSAGSLRSGSGHQFGLWDPEAAQEAN